MVFYNQNMLHSYLVVCLIDTRIYGMYLNNSRTCAIRHLEFSDILWHLTKMYGPKVFLLARIKPVFFNILYNPTHLPGSLVCWIRQVPLYINTFHCLYFVQMCFQISTFSALFFMFQVSLGKYMAYCYVRSLLPWGSWPCLCTCE
jgi:hypothetical protein